MRWTHLSGWEEGSLLYRFQTMETERHTWRRTQMCTHTFHLCTDTQITKRTHTHTHRAECALLCIPIAGVCTHQTTDTDRHPPVSVCTDTPLRTQKLAEPGPPLPQGDPQSCGRVAFLRYLRSCCTNLYRTRHTDPQHHTPSSHSCVSCLPRTPTTTHTQLHLGRHADPAKPLSDAGLSQALGQGCCGPPHCGGQPLTPPPNQTRVV